MGMGSEKYVVLVVHIHSVTDAVNKYPVATPPIGYIMKIQVDIVRSLTVECFSAQDGSACRSGIPVLS